jgi:hypothetical protein
MVSGLSAGFLLDRQWHWLRGEMDQSKRPALLALGRVLAEAQVAYAIIGGLALQVHQREPRTTLDIDVAVLSRESIPREALRIAAGDTPVHFTDDPAFARAITEAGEIMLDDVSLRVIRVQDLLHEKLRAGSDPARRRSKRLQDLADAQSLLEQDPDLIDELSPEERAVLAALPS